MKITNAQIAISSICLIMAFAITLQIRSVSHNRIQSPENTRSAELISLLQMEKERNENLQTQLYALKDDLYQYQEKAATSSDYSKVLSSQLQRAEVLAWLTAVEGPGVIVTVKDSSLPSGAGSNPNDYIAHDLDILWIINELNDAGAEAIQINGERVVATSEIRCAGATISINNNRFAAPFEIMAIGDSANMENALMMRGGVYDALKSYGLDIVVKKSTKLTVNAYKGNINFVYATPVQEEPAKKEGQQ
jgi:uncharacterized protein YlxW (UPF0749 family)